MRDKTIDQQLVKYLKSYTDMDDAALEEVVSNIPIKTFQKGDILLHQGQMAEYCIYVISGCVRQYRINEDGDEVTSEFYTEEQWINIFNESIHDQTSKYTLTCLEDCILIYSPSSSEEVMFEKFGALKDMVNLMMGEKLGEINESLYNYASLSPEARYKNLLEKRPGLIDRVPQHQLASYLGIKPESLSRIKKRIAKGQ
ncbi:Crp/Fnr family transcriptional regulator [Fusibacter sp. JL216-2]|uniref:Crp/Fnr family transcriptional regulator n=1 Tax=Fusibacter sp. JL216-2 TaxID=3071453 RepID=UPI003D34EAC1